MSYLLSKTEPLSQYPYRSWAKGPCFYCERLTFRSDRQLDWMFTRDHIVPRVKLRGHVRSRFQLPTVACCYWCNHHKANLSVEAFMHKCHPKLIKPAEWWQFVHSIHRKCRKAVDRADTRVHLPEARAIRDHNVQGRSAVYTSLHETSWG